MEKNNQGQTIYMVLCAVFIASLVACNLIFQKFFMLDVHYTVFVLSVGILPYPVTFLVTDVISEIYGKKKADTLVFSGFIASVFIMLVLYFADILPAVYFSPVDNDTFSKVFGLFGPAVFASMSAYLLAQFIDIRIFHLWKDFTKGKHLWLRNNLSTVFSQMIDTSSVLVLLCIASDLGWATGLDWSNFLDLFVAGYLFKVCIAIIDTPMVYLSCYLLRRKFDLEVGQTIEQKNNS